LDWVQRSADRLRPAAIQLTGGETPDYLEKLKSRVGCPVWKSVHLPAVGEEGEDLQTVLGKIEGFRQAGCDLIILDTSDKKAGLYGGTGLQSDWSLAARVVEESPLPIFLAGGINPDNVVRAVLEVRPKGVDLASGVEERKGKKSKEKLVRFFENLKSVQAGSLD
jgi:phosphoribosylanthranilate isomerase